MKLALERPLPKREEAEKHEAYIETASITLYKPPQPVPDSNYSELIERYAEAYNADANIMKSIAQCESGFKEDAVNGGFGGMYQFLATTWSSNRTAMGEDPNPDLRFNGEEAIKTAAFKMGRDGYGAWPACYQQALAKI